VAETQNEVGCEDISIQIRSDRDILPLELKITLHALKLTARTFNSNLLRHLNNVPFNCLNVSISILIQITLNEGFLDPLIPILRSSLEIIQLHRPPLAGDHTNPLWHQGCSLLNQEEITTD